MDEQRSLSDILPASTLTYGSNMRSFRSTAAVGIEESPSEVHRQKAPGRYPGKCASFSFFSLHGSSGERAVEVLFFSLGS
jgi:hypothetical protein